jgi:hypothetical protein
MKKVEIGLKVVGVLIAVTGFYISQADQVPWVLRIVSPKYLPGMEGLRKLEVDESLMPGDKGFDELCDIVVARLRPANVSRDFGIIRLEEFKLLSVMKTEYKGKSALMLLPVTFEMSDGGGGVETIPSLQLGLDQIRSRDVFHWIAALLFLGMGFVEVPTIVIQCLENRRSKAKKGPCFVTRPPM